jgi:Signal transduction histidine kinase
MSEIRELCQRYTDLNAKEIKIIEEVSANLQLIANLEDADAFVDCTCSDGDAIVVAEAKPSYVQSSYKKSVVGMLAKQENEPAVARTFRLGVATKQMKAITQESCNVVQTVEPIRNGSRVIGVLILEKQGDDQHHPNDRLHLSQKSYETMAKALTQMVGEDNWLTECIDEALLMVSYDGIVTFRNSLAESLYTKLGYVGEILGQAYDNIRLIDAAPAELGSYSVIDAAVGKFHLSIKHVQIDSEEMDFAVIINDVTGIKEQEKELILKSVAIKEMHHRVKNNLQTIASLLRLQVRRNENAETRKVLVESMNRILSIAATHEILAQSGVDQVNIADVLLNVKNNTVRYFARPNFNVTVSIEGDNFEVDSDLATSVALIVNELIQNSLEYAFVGKKGGRIRIIVTKGELYSQLSVVDDGRGFHVDTRGKSRLGLSIVKALVKDKLRGNLDIESDHSGTKVTFTFKNNIIDASSVT